MNDLIRAFNAARIPDITFLEELQRLGKL